MAGAFFLLTVRVNCKERLRAIGLMKEKERGQKLQSGFSWLFLSLLGISAHVRPEDGTDVTESKKEEEEEGPLKYGPRKGGGNENKMHPKGRREEEEAVHSSFNLRNGRGLRM